MILSPVVMLALFIVCARIFLKANGNLTGFSPHVIFMKYAPTVSVIAACGHLLISQKQSKRQILPYIHLDTLAWVVYAIFALELIIIIVSPLLIYIVPGSSQRFNISTRNTAISDIFRQVKNIFEDGKKPEPTIPIVYGLATVYSSVFMAFGIIFTIVLALLLGVNASNGLIVLLLIVIGCLFVFSVLRYESAKDLKELLQPRFSLIVSYYLLYSYGFYCTSHQPTISQIDWNAAFVGRTANFDHSNVLSAVLVLLAIFNANFLLLILFPLIVLFPFMLYAIYPKLCGSKGVGSAEYKRVTLNIDEDNSSMSVANVTRGEINLFENEGLFMSSVFKVGSQLMILQGAKALASMIACTILCRHLMVWKIFAPRFIYEGISTYISFVAIILGFLLLIRVHKSVKILVAKISKNS
jgi:GPI ethanolamine phosphate transferase 3 subunit O